jgi:hypothetical protein
MNALGCKIKSILDPFKNEKPSLLVRVEYHNKEIHEGFFAGFRDEFELFDEGRFRIVIRNRVKEFEKDLKESGKANPIHSIIIDLFATKSLTFYKDGTMVKQLTIDAETLAKDLSGSGA